MKNERTFGVEIEISSHALRPMAALLRAAGIPVFNQADSTLGLTPERANRDIDVTTLPDYKSAWKVVSDGSVSSGCEVVSPILSGAKGLAEVKRVVKAMRQGRAKADIQCGLHVHVGAGDLSIVELQNVARRYAKFEPTIDTFVDPRRRGNTSEWCKSMDRVVDVLDTKVYSTPQEMIRYIGDRYRKLNLSAFMRHGTVEFRQLEGTVSWIKITNWIEFCVQFVEASRLDAQTNHRIGEALKNRYDGVPGDCLKLNIGYDLVDATDVAYLLRIDRHEVSARIEKINEKVPGFLTRDPDNRGYWNVKKIEAAPMDYPKVTNDWTTGIPAHVVANLRGIAKTHSASC